MKKGEREGKKKRIKKGDLLKKSREKMYVHKYVLLLLLLLLEARLNTKQQTVMYIFHRHMGWRIVFYNKSFPRGGGGYVGVGE